MCRVSKWFPQSPMQSVTDVQTEACFSDFNLGLGLLATQPFKLLVSNTQAQKMKLYETAKKYSHWDMASTLLMILVYLTIKVKLSTYFIKIKMYGF